MNRPKAASGKDFQTISSLFTNQKTLRKPVKRNTGAGLRICATSSFEILIKI